MLGIGMCLLATRSVLPHEIRLPDTKPQDVLGLVFSCATRQNEKTSPHLGHFANLLTPRAPKVAPMIAPGMVPAIAPSGPAAMPTPEPNQAPAAAPAAAPPPVARWLVGSKRRLHLGQQTWAITEYYQSPHVSPICVLQNIDLFNTKRAELGENQAQEMHSQRRAIFALPSKSDHNVLKHRREATEVAFESTSIF